VVMVVLFLGFCCNEDMVIWPQQQEGWEQGIMYIRKPSYELV
jgi:hypothetical protein